MQEHEIGLNIGEDGLHFFGVDELNELIQKGHKVLRVVPGEVLVAEVDEEDEPEDGEEVEGDEAGEHFALSGFTMKVELQEPSSVSTPPGIG